jgi:EpsI family protein
VLGLGLALLVVGDVGSVAALQQVSILVSLTGIVLLLFGREMLRQVWFPLAYLLFMIPIWEVATEPLQPSFQRFSATLGTEFLRLGGIPVRLDGVLLELPNVTLEVAAECSGVNFLVAILAIGIPQAYILLERAGERAFVIAFAVATALATNALRVAVIGALAYYGLAGAEIHGPGHALQGMSVAVVGFVAVFGIVQLLAARARRRDLGAGTVPVTSATPWNAGSTRAPSRVALTICALLIGVAAVQAFRPRHAADLRMALSSFPIQIGSWHAGPAVSAPVVIGESGADDTISRIYTAPAGTPVQLYVGYFRYQLQAKELVNERMSELHGASSVIRLPLADGTTRAMNEAFYATDRKRRQHILFWYEIDGRPVVSRLQAKAWTIWDSLTSGRTNGAVIVLVSDLPPGELPAGALDATRSFAQLVAATAPQFLAR